MTDGNIKGLVNSIQSLGTVDGPGVRFVVFMQGCNLRCGCCHNPDTWNLSDGTPYTARELADTAMRYTDYYGKTGGITVSGGEPLLQAEFVGQLFEICRSRGINTCLDTSGSILNDSVKALLSHTNRVLLDIKYTTDEQYRKFVGCDIKKPLEFLDYLNRQKIKVTIRQVIIPTLNDNADSIKALKEIARNHKCVDKIELLPFKKMCRVKYESLSLKFAFEHFDEPTNKKMAELNALIQD